MVFMPTAARVRAVDAGLPTAIQHAQTATSLGKGLSYLQAMGQLQPPQQGVVPATRAPYADKGLEGLVQMYEQMRPLTPAQLDAIRKVDMGDPGGAWAQVEWADIQRGAAHHVLEPDLISQGPIGLCGAVSAIHATAVVDPGRYVDLALGVYQTGTFDGVACAEELLANPPVYEAVDWMLASAIQDTENDVYDFEGTTDEEFEVAASVGDVAAYMTKVVGCKKVATYTSYMCGALDNVHKVADLMKAHGNDVVVTLFAKSEALLDTVSYENHFAHVKEPPSVTPAGVEIVCHNAQKHWFDPTDLNGVILEFIVGARREDISL